MSIWDKRTEKIVKNFKVNVNSTEPLSIKTVKKESNVFLVKESIFPNLYIIYTEEGKKIACCPHIIGKKLNELSLKAAIEAAQVIKSLVNLRKNGIVFEHVLRAGPGYNLHNAFKLNGIKFKEVFIRPRYEIKSYRQHRFRKLKIVFKNFEKMPKNKRITLIKPDTEATGNSARVSIIEAIKESEIRGSRIDMVILYGFISLPALKILRKIAKKFSFDLVAFSIGNVTPLAHNKYDMPVYGVDESYYKAKKKIKKLGCVTDFQILKKYLPIYVPGCDQPGDWSARQEVLFTGNGYEKVDSREHLTNSMNLIKSLMKISDFEDWQKKIAERELCELRYELKTLKYRKIQKLNKNC
jgi:hypothetical protein